LAVANAGGAASCGKFRRNDKPTCLENSDLMFGIGGAVFQSMKSSRPILRLERGELGKITPQKNKHTRQIPIKFQKRVVPHDVKVLIRNAAAPNSTLR